MQFYQKYKTIIVASLIVAVIIVAYQNRDLLKSKIGFE